MSQGVCAKKIDSSNHIQEPALTFGAALLLLQCKTKDVSKELEQVCNDEAGNLKTTTLKQILNSDLASQITTKALETIFNLSASWYHPSQELTQLALAHPRAQEMSHFCIKSGFLSVASTGDIDHLKTILKHPTVTSSDCGEAYITLIKNGHEKTAQTFKYLRPLEFDKNIHDAFAGAIRTKNIDAFMELLTCCYKGRVKKDKTEITEMFVCLLTVAREDVDKKGESVFMKLLLPQIDFSSLSDSGKVLVERFFWESKIAAQEFIVDYLLNTPMKDWIKQDINSVHEMRNRCRELWGKYNDLLVARIKV